MTQTFRLRLPRPSAHCFERFCDVVNHVHWVPGVQQAEVVHLDGAGLPAEVRYRVKLPNGPEVEFTLLYAYDAPRRRAVWLPGDDASLAVRGFVGFEDRGAAGCEATYAFEHCDGRRTEPEDAIAQGKAAAESFRRYVTS